ncbi:hypothetical protein [Treponema sp. R6D11]
MTVKEKIPHIITVVLFVIFITLGLASATTPSSNFAIPNSRWAIGEYIDQFGDKTGDFFMRYSDKVNALFTGGGWTNKQTILSELQFSQNEGLKFYVINNDLAPVFFSTTDVLFNIKLPDESTKEFNGRGIYNDKNSHYYYFIPYNDDLLNTLLQENIIVRFAISSIDKQAQFQLPPKFRESYEVLKSRKKENVNLPLRWSVGAFTDKWGDKTGDYYVQFDGEVKTEVYSSNETATIKEISFSTKEGLTFKFFTFPPYSRQGNILFRIILPDETTVDFNGYGNDNVLYIPYSEKLLNILLQENVIIVFTTQGMSKIQSSFSLPPRFKEAYELLQKK